MRMAILMTGLLAILPGCADIYYQALGEDRWPHEDGSLYHRLGGKEGVADNIDGLMQTVAVDPRISDRFAHADIPKFKGVLAEQICVVTGGPCVYTGPGMRDVHVPLVLSNADFDAFLEDFRISLHVNHVEPDDEEELMGLLEAMRGQIVSVES
jgi:hemoglobin